VHIVDFYYTNGSEYCQTQNSVTILLHGCVGTGVSFVEWRLCLLE